METCINIARVGPEAPQPEEWRSYGPSASPAEITILNGFARVFAIREEVGAFSLKWIPQGAARYAVDRVQHRLEGDKVLLLHAGQPYEIEFLDRSGTESFCLFFAEPLLGQALASLDADGDACSAASSGRHVLEFADMVFTPPSGLMSALHRLRRGIGRLDDSAEQLEETLLSLLNDLATISQEHRQLAGKIPAKRPTTRRLLLGRLQRAKEMIDDAQGRPQPLEELARASCLSKFHLLRLFKATFDASPMEYAEQCRVARSKDLLRNTRRPIGDIAEQLGYESQGALARMFRRHVGMTPRAFRAS
jgi:AraC-like DNA-binding protein